MSKLPLGSGRGSCCCASGGLLSAQTTFPDGRSIMTRSEEHTSELQSLRQLVCRLLPEKKNEPIGVQIGIVPDTLPHASFQLFRQPDRQVPALKPVGLGDQPNIRSRLAMITPAPEPLTF